MRLFLVHERHGTAILRQHRDSASSAPRSGLIGMGGAGLSGVAEMHRALHPAPTAHSRTGVVSWSPYLVPFPCRDRSCPPLPSQNLATPPCRARRWLPSPVEPQAGCPPMSSHKLAASSTETRSASIRLYTRQAPVLCLGTHTAICQNWVLGRWHGLESADPADSSILCCQLEEVTCRGLRGAEGDWSYMGSGRQRPRVA
jgi:hypothetical protein